MILKKILPYLAGICLSSLALISYSNSPSTKKIVADSTVSPLAAVANSFLCAEELKPQLEGLSTPAFELALKGYQRLVEKGSLTPGALLAIADLSLPSDQTRFFILNIQQGVVHIQTLVAHGKNSGERFATHFSNKHSSLQSSLGFFKTGNPYEGSNGKSLKLIGLEKGINDQALTRGIVLHGAPYVNEVLAKQRGWIGRSWGCPAVPSSQNEEIIQLLRNDQCLFIYHPSYKPTIL
jgi:hypothetical protein